MTDAASEDEVEAAAGLIRRHAAGPAPRVGLLLGSGLGSVAGAVESPAVLPYASIPGFPPTAVEGHAGRLLLGEIGATAVAVMDGRAHFYEHGRADEMRTPLRALRAAGCEIVVLTNAAGGLRPQAVPGSLMLIADHINFHGTNPLVGATPSRGSGRTPFVDMTHAYDPALRRLFNAAAANLGIDLHEGVYCWFSGPSFETPAEIRAAATLGADAVGMSTVPETILARHCGLRVAGLSIITNRAAGMGDAPLRHEDTVACATRAAESVRRLCVEFLSLLADRNPRAEFAS